MPNRHVLVLCLLAAAMPLHAQKPDWVRSIADAKTQKAYVLKVDPQGNPILAGEYGSYPLEAGIDSRPWSQFDLFVHKLDPAGKTIWFRHIGSPDYSDMRPHRISMDVDDQGRIYVMGWVPQGPGNPLRFTSKTGDTTVADSGLGGNFLCRYDADGKLAWFRQFTASTGKLFGFRIVARPGGFMFRGYTSSKIAFPALPDSLPAGNSYDFKGGGKDDGSALWLAPFLPDTEAGTSRALLYADAGDGGWYVDTSRYLERYDAKGKRLWQTQITDGDGVLANAIASPGPGGVYLYGYVAPGARIPRPGLPDTVLQYVPDPDSRTGCVIRIDGQGKVRWARTVVEGDMYVQDNNALPFYAASDGTVALLHRRHSHEWVRIDSTGKVTAFDASNRGSLETESMMAGDGRGHLYFAGSYTGDYDFMGTLMPNDGIASDVFLARVPLAITPDRLYAPDRPGRGMEAHRARVRDGLGRHWPTGSLIGFPSR